VHVYLNRMILCIDIVGQQGWVQRVRVSFGCADVLFSNERISPIKYMIVSFSPLSMEALLKIADAGDVDAVVRRSRYERSAIF
jgi:hypothetical protein